MTFFYFYYYKRLFQVTPDLPEVQNYIEKIIIEIPAIRILTQNTHSIRPIDQHNADFFLLSLALNI